MTVGRSCSSSSSSSSSLSFVVVVIVYSLHSLLLLLLLVLVVDVAEGDVLLCRTLVEIREALMDVEPGDEIVVAPGVYRARGQPMSGGTTAAYLSSAIDGTEENPIVLRSQDPDNPAIINGGDAARHTCIRIFGAYWTIQDITVTNAQKGIVFDNAPHGRVVGCTIHGIGLEGIHWRDGSDYGLIERCRVYNTGTVHAGFGEAIYIGTDRGAWETYDHDVTYVTVRHCVIGPNVAAEAFDIKEGTEEIVIEHNYIDASGMSGQHFADSFIDLKGTRSYIRYNAFHRNGETNLRKGIAVIDRDVILSAYEHAIHNNIFSLDGNDDIYLVNAHGGTSDVWAWDNIRLPAEDDDEDNDHHTNDYSPSVHDFCCPPWYSSPTASPVTDNIFDREPAPDYGTAQARISALTTHARMRDRLGSTTGDVVDSATTTTTTTTTSVTAAEAAATKTLSSTSAATTTTTSFSSTTMTMTFWLAVLLLLMYR